MVSYDDLSKIQVEATALSSAAGWDESFFQVTENLTEDDFTTNIHKAMFRAMKRMRGAGMTTCPRDSFADFYAQDAIGLEDEAEQVNYTLEFAPCSSSTLIDHYLPILKQATMRRKLWGLSSELFRKISDLDLSPEEIATWLQNESISTVVSGSDGAKYLFDTKSALESANAARNRPAERVGSVGIEGLDGMIGGLEPGQTLVVGARPGCGKTALAVQIAMKNAIHGKSVLFISLEMTVEELTDRCISHLSLVDSYSVRRGAMSPSERESVDHAEGRFLNLPLVFYDGDASLDKLLSTVRSQKRARGIDLVIVDYLQRVRVSQVVKDRHDLMVANISRSFTALCKELRIIGVLLAQPNRTGAEALKMHHFEGSGAIEQDAHKIILMSKKNDDGPPCREQEIKIELAKNRSGITGKVQAMFLKHLSMFRELSSHD